MSLMITLPTFASHLTTLAAPSARKSSFSPTLRPPLKPRQPSRLLHPPSPSQKPSAMPSPVLPSPAHS
ncbi:hypothetical protein EMCG_06799 [[Emmonsia] crescens]|uniref:Uncharacterized protein n=1 Tax=[Emmonsia] crescens TaxID=73230 RepID=A0A0G2IBC1_9EURO|nr:hypothetical protein EMCG_06799 [Emmonsia crescens UAMH 3008]